MRAIRLMVCQGLMVEYVDRGIDPYAVTLSL